MSLSDCPRCWNTPCTCGYEYRKMKKSYRIKLASVVLGIEESRLCTLISEEIPDKHPMFDENRGVKK